MAATRERKTGASASDPGRPFVCLSSSPKAPTAANLGRTKARPGANVREGRQALRAPTAPPAVDIVGETAARLLRPLRRTWGDVELRALSRVPYLLALKEYPHLLPRDAWPRHDRRRAFVPPVVAVAAHAPLGPEELAAARADARTHDEEAAAMAARVLAGLERGEEDEEEEEVEEEDGGDGQGAKRRKVPTRKKSNKKESLGKKKKARPASKRAREAAEAADKATADAEAAARRGDWPSTPARTARIVVVAHGPGVVPGADAPADPSAAASSSSAAEAAAAASSSFGIREARLYAIWLATRPEGAFCLLLPQWPTSQALECLAIACRKLGVRETVFTYHELAGVDPLQHKDVPAYTVVPPERVPDVLRAIRAKLAELKNVDSYTDGAARFCAYSPGTLLHTAAPSPTVGTAVSYTLVK